MADTPTASRSNTASTAETSPPSEGSTVSGPAAPANTIIDTVGGIIPNPSTLSALLGGLAVNPPTPANAETQSAISAPADIPARKHDGQATELYPEASNWAADAEEDLENALKRMAMAAEDKNKIDPSKTIKQHYSEALAKTIKAAEIDFDVSYMEEARETETETEELDSTA